MDPAGDDKVEGTWLAADVFQLINERLVSVKACDLLPAVASTTKIHSFPIHHVLQASEPKLALLEGTVYVSE